MADSYVTPKELTEQTSLAETDEFMVTNAAAATKRFTASRFWTWVWNKIQQNTLATLNASSNAPVRSAAVNTGLAAKVDTSSITSTYSPTGTAPINGKALNGALFDYQPIVTNVINGSSEWDTGIYINKSIKNTNNYKYKKTHLVMLSAINGYGDTVSSRLVLISIGRSGNYITTTPVAEKSASASSAWFNNIQLIPSSETTEINDNNTLVIKNNNTVAYSVEVRFL